MYCISYHVHQVPRLGVLHLSEGVLDLPSSVLHSLSCKSGVSLGVLYLPTGVLHMPSCSSGASLGCTAFASRCSGFTIKCTAEAIMYIRSLTCLYCICHQDYCICHHLTSVETLECTTLANKCTVEAMPHLGVLHLPSSVLHILSIITIHIYSSFSFCCSNPSSSFAPQEQEPEPKLEPVPSLNPTPVHECTTTPVTFRGYRRHPGRPHEKDNCTTGNQTVVVKGCSEESYSNSKQSDRQETFTFSY